MTYHIVVLGVEDIVGREPRIVRDACQIRARMEIGELLASDGECALLCSCITATALASSVNGGKFVEIEVVVGILEDELRLGIGEELVV